MVELSEKQKPERGRILRERTVAPEELARRKLQSKHDSESSVNFQ